MVALTLRISDDKHQRLRNLARGKSMTVNRLLDEMTTRMLLETDARTRFELYAARGKDLKTRALELLEKAASKAGDQQLKS